MATPKPLTCYRCGQPGYVDWIETTRLGDAEPTYVMGRSYCETPGCADPDGSRRLEPLTPGEMAERADRAWLARHEAMVADR